MKKVFLLMGIIFLLSGCAIHNGLTSNMNNHNTQVVLSKKNFEVVAKVKGQASATYVFGIGGLYKNGLIETARTKMMENANLVGGSKAIINETVEMKHNFYLLVLRNKVIVSGYVVEFKE